MTTNTNFSPALAASLDAAVLAKLTVVERNNTPTTRNALLELIGQCAEAHRPNHPDAAAMAREYASATLALGMLDVLRERYNR